MYVHRLHSWFLKGRSYKKYNFQMGLVELQYGVERPQCIGSQLQKGQPYGLLIYIYFYCQSSEKYTRTYYSFKINWYLTSRLSKKLLFLIFILFSPDEATAPLLPYLVEHILKLPNSCKPPPYIIKALWLVFAVSVLLLYVKYFLFKLLKQTSVRYRKLTLHLGNYLIIILVLCNSFNIWNQLSEPKH